MIEGFFIVSITVDEVILNKEVVQTEVRNCGACGLANIWAEAAYYIHDYCQASIPA
jgi:hypothetical protein